MKKLLLKIIVFLINKLPNNLLRICIDFFCSNKNYYAKKIVSEIQAKKIINSKSNFIKKYHILTDIEQATFKVKLIDDERYEKVRTPDVYEVCKENYLTLRKHEIAIYCFPDASIQAKSDIIKFGGNIFWEKANRPEFALTIPVDSDFISIDKLGRNIVAFEEKKLRNFESGFSLCGVHTNTWAHFIISYLPKLIALDELSINSKLSLFVPRIILQNNKDLIIYVLNNINLNKNIEIIYVEDDEVIQCSRLYYCNAIGYLCDHSTYVNPASTFISDYGGKAVQKLSNHIWPTIKISEPRKLYIGRGVGRNLYNASEVEKYFIENGFEIVYPYLMTLEEKINIFGNASHIAGPVSSGFANMIFCKNKVKILGFINFARCFDPFISGLSYAANFNHEILYITGHEEVNVDINNSYIIELDRIISCCEKISYFE